MEFERRFAGSVGGKLWIFVGPVMTISVIWIVLDLGLGLRTSSGPSYGMSLAVGLCAWIFFAEALNTSVSSIVGSPHLVKKVVFPVALLPLSNVMAAFTVHLLLLVVVVAALLGHGQVMTWNALMLPFWSFCLLLLTASTATLGAGLNVVFRDMSAIVPNFVSLLFWLTPVIWPISNIPAKWRSVALLNPAAVVVEGYRYALLGGTDVVDLTGTIIFCFTLAAIVLGSITLFRKMRPWFANVL